MESQSESIQTEVILNGDAPVPIALVSGGPEAVIPPKTTEQKIARRDELKAKSTMLLAIPYEHILKFHRIKDAKTLWEAIKNSYFSGRCKSKVAEKSTISLEHSFLDHASNSQNVAFVSSESTSSTNEAVNIAHDVSAASLQGQVSASTYADDVMFSFFANQSNSPQLDNEDLE
ncbi:hypothetical protein Tco_0612666 [Tanacetum coccineum]